MAISAVFLDRDGVINRERADYVKCWEEFEFLPGAVAALAKLARLDTPIIVVSNQSVVGRGISPISTINQVNQRMCQLIRDQAGRLDAVFVCPHHPDDQCACRKPRPGLLLQAAQQFGLALDQAVFVGDSMTDAMAAYAARCRAILVQTGRQGARLDELVQRAQAEGTIAPIPPPIVADLTAAATMIAQWHAAAA